MWTFRFREFIDSDFIEGVNFEDFACSGGGSGLNTLGVKVVFFEEESDDSEFKMGRFDCT